MQIRKRNGNLEFVDLDKITKSINRHAEGLRDIDPMVIVTQTISGLSDGATTKDIDDLSIRIAASLIFEEPNYSKLAARILSTVIAKEVYNQGITSFMGSIKSAHDNGLLNDRTYDFIWANYGELAPFLSDSDWNFEFFGLRTLYDRYLLRDPNSRLVIETPQYFFMRVACGLSETAAEAVSLYRLMSALEYMPSSPTLFNSGTTHEQMSSCYLLDSPADDLKAIYDTYSEIAQLSKYAGGIGVSWSRIRSDGSLIKGTNGLSNGVVPWLKTLDSSVASVNQGGRRKGAACVYLETWHADIEDFLELRENTGAEERRARNLNLANWIPDLFMARVKNDEMWSLFDPKDVPHFVDIYGGHFEREYCEAEKKGLAKKQIPARELYAKMMKTLAETGNGWMNFKDSANYKGNQVGNGDVIHLSNLCTEIMEVTSAEETAVCNLGSINLGACVENGEFNSYKLHKIVQTVIPLLDRVIDRNFYPSDKAENSNPLWRPIGLGVMGLADVFFKLGLAFDSPEAQKLSAQIQEHIYYEALSASCTLAEKKGPYPNYLKSRTADGHLSFDLWGAYTTLDWTTLRERIRLYGLRNSLLIAIAPTSTIATICGCYECIEPQTSNLFKRETLSGEFLQVNKYLISELKSLGLWNDEVKDSIKANNGSIQGTNLNGDIKRRYRTVWEMPMRSLIDMAADRAPFIDQSQSLNLFIEEPTIGKLSSMYLYAWEKGLKSTYYLRSRPATTIAKVAPKNSPFGTYGEDGNPITPQEYAEYWAKARQHSLENPEICEVCQ